MADNSSLPTASGNETFANDDIGSVKYPRVKVTYGSDGSATDVDDTHPLPMVIRPSTTASAETATRIVAAASTNTGFLKASAGSIYSIDLFNVAAYNVFLKLYNKASAPTLASDVPVLTIPIPAGAGFSRDFSRGRAFSTGIAYAITKLQGDTDATALVAGDVTGSIAWI